MDAEKLPEIGVPFGPAGVPPGGGTHSAGGTRRIGSALDAVDALLSVPGAVSGDEADLLLDLRHLLKERVDAEKALRVFCDLRRRLEQRHYLLFYRLRRWLEHHMVAEVGSSSRVAGEKGTVAVPLQLNCYCVEALRRQNLCAALPPHPAGWHLVFRFR